MPLLNTSGNVTADAFGGGVAAVPNYIEDVFSTYLYNGGSPPKTITNGIDLAGKGGLTWIKSRNLAESHRLVDTVRGATKALYSNATDAQVTEAAGLTAFTSSGFTVNYDSGYCGNTSTDTYASWTFRKQPKFFDVVTYTGNGSNQTISHSLGSAPGCIIVKCTSNGTTNWFVYHSSLAVTSGRPGFMYLDSTSAVQTGDPTVWPSVPTSTTFEVGSYNALNGSGRTYVAYLFAHNAGGFGLTGTDNVISCGSYTGNGSSNGPSISLGYEPQWLLVKRADGIANWMLFDNMRGLPVGSNGQMLNPNKDFADQAVNYFSPTATGFNVVTNIVQVNASGENYIYIAIRRGPMKVPTDATKVLAAVTRSGTGTTAIITGASSPPDLVMVKSRNNATEFAFTDRLRGVTNELSSAYSFSEADFGANPTVSINMNGWTAPAGYGTFNQSGYTYVDYMFSRWPNVFDEVCYTGNATAGNTFTHNLGVAPELMIIKSRNFANYWTVYSAATGNTKDLFLNTTDAAAVDDAWNNTSPTSSVVTLGAGSLVNGSAKTYVAYLFATCAGVSKVGSYTGTGATQTIACGFTGGARFVLVKRVNSTGDWYVWDTARGMVSGTDPSLLLNSTAAEVNANSIYTTTGGFQIVSTATGINASGGTYIFLAIA